MKLVWFKKVWLIFRQEYLRHVLRKRFLLTLLSLPLGALLVVAVAALIIFSQYDARPVGYIDLCGVLSEADKPTRQSDQIYPPLEMRRYENEDQARADIKSKTIQAYYVIQPDYLMTGKVRQVSLDALSNFVDSQFSNFLRINLLKNQPPKVAARLLSGANITVRSLEGSRQASSKQFFKLLIPLAGGLLFIIATNTSGGYLLQALVEEKQNRTMEIVVTSVSPGQLMAGKIAGNMAVGLTELGAWLSFALVGLIVASTFIPGLQIPFEPGFVLLTLATLIPAFVMVAALMAAVGATATEAREAQQVAGLFTLPIIAPYWFISLLMMRPNSPLAVALSLFPLTAPVSLPLRSAFTDVPAWQIAASLTLLVLLATGSIWLAGRAFRMGMLSYGKRLSWKEIFARHQT
jgi:ABC-2 type transport system permease protein